MSSAQPDHDPDLLLGLLGGCQRADRGSQRRLYMLYYSYAMGICLRYARTRDEAMEAVNDGFMKVFRDVARFDTTKYDQLTSTFRGWLKRIMIHTAIDQYRANGKQRLQQSLDDTPALQYADDHYTALDSLSYDEIIALVSQLTPGYRAVFNLYVIDGYTHEEIAGQLGISVGASKSNLSKARAHLKTLLLKNRHHAYAGSIG
ncbi:sigma-70 family RNA polymerase sigma factor [Hymenobacter sp. 15J16-1T3B]|uniref:RNA polymerase sigma factor n=1 Tax=Hymenobacter sp. 15J16-1T3B TaxID=2886941 RepID=UPI001D12547D|nr:sigma-70 family RNA polymerase sigma factor [Hymenobacter sp. 15J16-1T3B]MCC3157597.1 sigma-70 family RNA polymerase sigma factor [Hymenobacter sp. 15J16-1T3B]